MPRIWALLPQESFAEYTFINSDCTSEQNLLQWHNKMGWYELAEVWCAHIIQAQENYHVFLAPSNLHP